jgi:hypothetical protein
MDIAKTLEVAKPQPPGRSADHRVIEAHRLSDKIKNPKDDFLYLRELAAETS